MIRSVMRMKFLPTFLETCLKTRTARRVGARGLQETASKITRCRPGALTGRIFKHALAFALLGVLTGLGGEILFEDNFKRKLGDGWSWVREHRDGWRFSEHGLEVRVEPGNLWGNANNAKNVLARPAPELGQKGIEIIVTVENRPTAQYEQVNLAWYYDDSHMVKLGQELVDGKLCIVMGREENDRTRTIKILPLDAFKVQLRIMVKGNSLRGQFRPAGSDSWQDVGESDLPAPENGKPKISLQFYQGPSDAEHWARASEFRVERL
jgi:regulation of enolase protein 1 (concanavalin A-like superfamily)